MKINFIKLLSVVLCLCVLCSAMAFTAFAEGEDGAAAVNTVGETSATDGENASNLTASDASADAGKTPGSSPWVLIVWVAILGLAFYFLLIRPEKKRKKEADNLRNGLKLGDTITTIGGFVGEVIRIDENTITIYCGNTKMELQKWAIRSIDEISEASVDDVDDDDADEDSAETK